MTLDQFLTKAAGRPTVWGDWDCHLWLADWVWACRGGDDPAAAFRGRYRTPLGALRLLGRQGGSRALVARLAASAGLAAVDPSQARPGDIGLLPCTSPRGVELIGGLFTGQRWTVLGWPAGIVAAPAQAALVWRV